MRADFLYGGWTQGPTPACRTAPAGGRASVHRERPEERAPRSRSSRSRCSSGASRPGWPGAVPASGTGPWGGRRSLGAADRRGRNARLTTRCNKLFYHIEGRRCADETLNNPVSYDPSPPYRPLRIAPVLALVAIAAYFPRQPAGFSFGGSCHFARRSASSASETSRSSTREGFGGAPAHRINASSALSRRSLSDNILIPRNCGSMADEADPRRSAGVWNRFNPFEEEPERRCPA